MNFEIRPQHVGISVANLDDAISWYGDILNFSLVAREFVPHLNCEIATVRNGDFEIELFGHRETKPVPKERLHPDDDMVTQGTKHMCFRVNDLDAFIGELRRKGVQIVVGPCMMGNNKLYYIADNSGVLIELMEAM